MIYIADKFGFVSGFYWGVDKHGEPVKKIKHCIDVRHALPFTNRYEAEQQYKQTYMGNWWFCTLSTGVVDTDKCPRPEPKHGQKMLNRYE